MDASVIVIPAFVIFIFLSQVTKTTCCSGSVNIAQGKLAKVSSLQNSDEKPELIVDGDNDGACVCTQKDFYGWFQVDLQSIYNISTIIVTNDFDQLDIELYLSSDVKTEEEWKQYVDNNDSCWYTYMNDGRRKGYRCNETTQGRYLRVYKNPQQELTFSVCEIEVYEKYCVLRTTSLMYSPTSNVTSNGGYCYWSCDSGNSTENFNKSLEQYLDQLRKRNAFSKKLASRYKRKFKCANDDRPSSYTIGCFSVLLLVFEVGCLLLNDFLLTYKQIKTFIINKYRR